MTIGQLLAGIGFIALMLAGALGAIIAQLYAPRGGSEISGALIALAFFGLLGLVFTIGWILQ
jgi:hypothetical protein